MDFKMIDCPKCQAKGYIDKNDIERFQKEDKWIEGKCDYCIGMKIVPDFYVSQNDPSTFSTLAEINKQKEEDLIDYTNILPQEIKLLLQYVEHNPTLNSFQFGNYPYLFKIATEEDIETYALNKKEEYLVAQCFSVDFYFCHLVYNFNSKHYYITNIKEGRSKKEKLKKPIKVANTLSELFENKPFERVLVEEYDDEYEDYNSNSYYNYAKDITGKVPDYFIPNKDMRTLYQELSPTSFFSDHKEYSTTLFKEYCDKNGLNEYVDIENFFNYKPQTEDFLNLIQLANDNLNTPKFLFIEFYQSAYVGILNIDCISDYHLSVLLKYGVIYNRIDVPERIYDILS